MSTLIALAITDKRIKPLQKNLDNWFAISIYTLIRICPIEKWLIQSNIISVELKVFLNTVIVRASKSFELQ